MFLLPIEATARFSPQKLCRQTGHGKARGEAHRARHTRQDRNLLVRPPYQTHCLVPSEDIDVPCILCCNKILATAEAPNTQVSNLDAAGRCVATHMAKRLRVVCRLAQSLLIRLSRVSPGRQLYYMYCYERLGWCLYWR